MKNLFITSALALVLAAGSASAQNASQGGGTASGGQGAAQGTQGSQGAAGAQQPAPRAVAPRQQQTAPAPSAQGQNAPAAQTRTDPTTTGGPNPAVTAAAQGPCQIQFYPSGNAPEAQGLPPNFVGAAAAPRRMFSSTGNCQSTTIETIQ